MRWKRLLIAATCLVAFGLLARLGLQRLSTDSAAPLPGKKLESANLFEVDGKPDSQQVELSPVDWPAFRGAKRVGEVDGYLLADWESPPKAIWQRKLGGGLGSCAMVGNFIITQSIERDEELTLCFNSQDGKLIWKHGTPGTLFEHFCGEGPRATPACTSRLVVTISSVGIVSCLELNTGKPIWEATLLADPKDNCIFGCVCSPLIIDDVVIISAGRGKNSLFALDLQTGKPRWQQPAGGASYSSPQLVVINGQPLIVNFDAKGLFLHATNDGTPIWHFSWVSNPPEMNNVCQPIVIPEPAGDTLFVSSGYGRGCARIRFESGSKPLTHKLLFQNRQLSAKFTCVVEHDQYVYGFDERILTCLDLRTGKRIWRKNSEFGNGQLIRVGDRLIVQGDYGRVHLVEVNSTQFREHGSFQGVEQRTWNIPAFRAGMLAIRNTDFLTVYQLPMRGSLDGSNSYNVGAPSKSPPQSSKSGSAMQLND